MKIIGTDTEGIFTGSVSCPNSIHISLYFAFSKTKMPQDIYQNI